MERGKSVGQSAYWDARCTNGQFCFGSVDLLRCTALVWKVSEAEAAAGNSSPLAPARLGLGPMCVCAAILVASLSALRGKFLNRRYSVMTFYETLGLLAQVQPETEGNPLLGLLIIGAIIWLCWAIFAPKKSKYLVTNSTSVRKVK